MAEREDPHSDVPIVIVDDDGVDESPPATAARGAQPYQPARPARRTERAKSSPRTLKPRFDTARLFGLLGCVAAVAFAGVAVLGWDYYGRPMAERPFHAFHEFLRPSGRWGRVLGVAGTALMVLNLSYLLRKRLLAWAKLGSLRSWMALHVFTGLVGPAMIILHAAFRPTSSLGWLALVAMLVVVVTGVVGRYIYTFVPRSREGHELELGDVRRRLAVLRDEIGRLGLSSTLLDGSGGRDVAKRSTSFVGTFFRVVWGDRERRRDLRRLRALVRSRPELRPRARGILQLAKRLYREEQWVARFHDIQWLMGSWRFFHRWLAIVMLLLALFHVALAVVYGNLWLFGGSS